MTLRRYAPMKQSRGTVIPHAMKLLVYSRDGGCVAFAGRLGPDSGLCIGGLEPDHVRASHATSMKSVTCPCNIVALCAGHHRYKTEHGRDVRLVLLDYLAQFGYGEHVEGHVVPGDCGHVDPVFGCCDDRVPA